MKIAVPYDKDGSVFQHFGRAEAFKLYEVSGDTAVPGEVIGTEGAGHEALAGFLAGKGVEAVVCGGIGPGAMAALADAGVKAVSGAAGNADQAAAAFARGELTETESPSCGGHEENGDCGGECGHHGCGEGEDCGCDSGCGGGCGKCGNQMPPVEGKNVGKTVRVHYEGTFNDGTRFDSSYERGEPLEFECGAGMMIHGFDQAVAAMNVGDIVNVHLMPEEAYGMPDPNAVMRFQTSELPGSEYVQVGQTVRLSNGRGQAIPVRVIQKDEKTITLDANHEMAGKELNFKIELVEIL
ncbi:MAG: FKBP-type peptidyl-prolyl cis-trans isomerase [Lachnospiraceae bacterium]|jgi:FKBP-type peptidyl-prolyl cis-trans isomerase 2/predicted Fe-Mo cluster-binding NifX family protein